MKTIEKSAVTSISDDLLGYCWCQASNLNKSELQGYESTALAVGSEDTADIEAGHESLWIYDLRFSLAGHGRLISFFRHIGEPARISLLATLLVAIAVLLCWQSSSSILPPIFRFSHALALIVSFWGPDFVWAIVLYCGYKLKKILNSLNSL